MPVLKPVRGIRLNKSHSLARGLVGNWLFNEGSGNKVFDLSGNGNTGTFQGTSPSWTSGKFGSAVLLPGTDEYADIGDNGFPSGSSPRTINVWFKLNGTATANYFIAYGTDAEGQRVDIGRSSTGWFGVAVSGHAYGFTWAGDTIWHNAIAVYPSGETSSDKWKIYFDGVEQSLSTQAGSPVTMATTLNLARIGRNVSGTQYFNGLIDHAMIWNRALSASEIALLHQEPFCMFDRAWRPGLIGGQIVELAGTSTALSSLSAIAKASRKVGGTIASTSNVDGSLGIIGGQIVELIGTVAGKSNVDGSLGIMGEGLPEMERSWLTEALFNGMTANAFKLGTSLSLGWFWVRVTGCSALYRGENRGAGGIGGVDFANILTVSNLDVSEVSPPSYISHNSGSTYFYVVRRFNNCGYQEHTLAAAVKVSIGSNGELAEPQPNNISSSKVEQVAGNKVRLTWFYCPLEQGSKPVSFNVYYDDRTGQIDYQDPLAIIEYKGRKFYSFQSSALETGEEGGGHLFAIRAEDAVGIENSSLAQLKIQLDTLSPDKIDILRAEAV